MTIVAGLSCDGGIVVSSDSQMSSGPTRRWEQKVWSVPAGGFIFGLAGAESSMHLLRDQLQSQMFLGKSLANIQVELSGVFSSILGVEYTRVRTLMGGVHDWVHMPQAEGVVGVYADGQPHLLHVNAAATVTDHARGFATAGTGASFGEHAITAFRQVRGVDLNLHQAKMLVFRVVQDAIAAAGGGTAIGGAVQMATLSLNEGKPVSAILRWDEPAIKDAVDNWMADEADRFRQHQPPDP